MPSNGIRMIYKSILRPYWFSGDAEKAHYQAANMLRRTFALPGSAALAKAMFKVSDPALEREVFGIKFPNPVGLAAGFDKDALLIDELAHFGFGFIEIGTVTPRPQPGNDKPRLFRLVKDEAIINRMGFNNQGVEVAATRLGHRQSKLIIGGNIGKNKVTANERALEDYVYCLGHLAPHVDYFVVNVSSPNTPGLRELQEKEPLMRLLDGIKKHMQQRDFAQPLLLKIAPDLNEDQLRDIIEIVKNTGTSGVVATNTTIDRNGLQSPTQKVEDIGMGGLSGRPLRSKSTEIIRFLSGESGKAFPIIGCGGIFTAEDALEKLQAGADLVQVYTGFIYEGPGMVKSILKGIIKHGK